jgi:hypothetical protein
MRPHRMQFQFLILLLFVIAAPAWSQAPKKLSAREIFYSAPSAETPAKKTVSQPAKIKEKPPAETAKSTSPEGTPREFKPSPTTSSRPAGKTMEVAFNPGETIPLGIRYSLLRRNGSESLEVDSETIFRSGDRIRLRVDVNTTGYLYIINRGSSGNWKVLFPSTEIAGGDNRVQKGIQYEIPPGHVFSFDEQPGKEKLFLVFSRQPVGDLDGLIYSLSDEQKVKPKENSRPDSGKMLLAQVNIRDNIIDRIRNLTNRDLIIEKVDETAPPNPSVPDKEKAVYVVNPSKSANARVVADVTLAHQ